MTHPHESAVPLQYGRHLGEEMCCRRSYSGSWIRWAVGMTKAYPAVLGEKSHEELQPPPGRARGVDCPWLPMVKPSLIPQKQRLLQLHPAINGASIVRGKKAHFAASGHKAEESTMCVTG
jgi:hypothetical protein